MFKLVFLFVVLVAVIATVTGNPHPGKTQAKKAAALQKHSAVHHGLGVHGRPATRVARSHGAHAPVHHSPGGSAHHSNKVAATHAVHGVHPGNHGPHAGNKAALHRPVKHRGHRK